MDGMFGFHSAPDYADRNLMSPDDLFDCSYGMVVPSVDRIPMFCSDDVTAAGSFHCPVDSEAASSAHRRGVSQLEDAAEEGREGHVGYENGAIRLVKDRIACHPCYPKLLEAYIDCQKVGAPPEIAAFLDEIRRENELRKHDGVVSPCSGVDPDLDIFMETYSEMLVKYKSELSRPLDDATTFLNNIQTQLRNLSKDDDGVVSSDDDENSDGEMEENEGCGGNDAAMSAEDRELKNKLLRKYGGHISNLKFEFSKKKKKGKLPKDARQILLEWWKLHYRWPYPTEGDKISLAEMSGLDQKQINNWFINQRKRHWRPSQHMHLAVMDNLFSLND